MNNYLVKEKLARLRKEWSQATDPLDKKIIEARAKLLKLEALKEKKNTTEDETLIKLVKETLFD